MSGERFCTDTYLISGYPFIGTWDSHHPSNSPWTETLSVYLAVGEKYYLNNNPVKKEALRETLQGELSRRMAWVVYFEADNDTLNMDAIYVMDVIQGLGAKLVWITPKTRRELEQNKQSRSRTFNSR